MKFLFKAKNSFGKVQEGTVEAMNWETAAKIIEKNGLTPITIQQEKATQAFSKFIKKYLNSVSQKELMIFFRQLSTLIEARVAIVTSLNTIEAQTGNEFLQIVLQEVSSDVKEGMSFSNALEKHESVFSQLVVNMVRAGELSGNLSQSIAFIADSIEENYKLTSQIKSALYYPVFVLSAAVIIGFLVATFVLPNITTMIKEMGVPVPWYTTVIINFGDFMQSSWWIVLLVLVFVIGGLAYYMNSVEGKYQWQIISLKLPVIGKLVQGVYVARFASNLSVLLGSGIPVVKALTIVADVVGNHIYKSVILQASESVKIGDMMSTSFLRSDKIPPIVAQMIHIGEETGTLPAVLQSVGKFYKQEVDATTKNLTALMEPVLIVFLGIGVAIMVMGILLPIYSIAGQM